MAWTQANLTALEAAIAVGATSVRYGERTVQYRGLDEMLRLRRVMRQELGLPAEQRATKKLVHYSKGVCG